MTSHGKQLPRDVAIAISLLEGAYVKHNGHTGEAYKCVNDWVWTVTGLLKEHTHDWTDDNWHAVQLELENLTREIPRGGANESVRGRRPAFCSRALSNADEATSCSSPTYALRTPTTSCRSCARAKKVPSPKGASRRRSSTAQHPARSVSLSLIISPLRSSRPLSARANWHERACATGPPSTLALEARPGRPRAVRVSQLEALLGRGAGTSERGEDRRTVVLGEL